MFEFLFKYPRSVYARGQFAFLGAGPKWLLILLILAAAMCLAWLIRSRLAQAAPVMRGWRVWVIWSLQTLLAAILLVLLWQPAITIAELKPQQNIIAVLEDDRHYFPAYQAVWLYRLDTAQRKPQFAASLRDMAGKVPDRKSVV